MIRAAIIGSLVGLAYMGVSGDAIHPLVRVSPPDTFTMYEDNPNWSCALTGDHSCSDGNIPQVWTFQAWYDVRYDA